MTKFGISVIAVAALVWLAPVGAHADENKEKLKGHKDRIEKSLKHKDQRKDKLRPKKQIKRKIKQLDRRTKHEAQHRKAADSKLKKKIKKEAAKRKTSDHQLKAKVTREIQNRKSADRKLKKKIDQALKKWRNSTNAKLKANLDQEIQDRKAADSGLQEQIDKESKDRNAAFFSLKDLIEELEARGMDGSCPLGMVPVGPLCVDKYEASVWPNPDGPNGLDPQLGIMLDDYTTCNDNGNDCKDKIFALSIENVTPSRFITWFQAQQACANSGKRLLTNAEWQMAAAGTPDPGDIDTGFDECNVSFANNPVDTGSRASCISNWLVHDMVGNVWEWVADWTQGSMSNIDATAGLTYEDDRLIRVNPAVNQGGGQNFPAALIRGGRFGLGTDAGAFAMNASLAPSFEAGSIGFRCGR